MTVGGTTILQAIHKTVSPQTVVLYSTIGSQLADAKVVLVVAVELPYAEMKGDRKDLSLAPEDLQLIQAAGQSDARVVTDVRWFSDLRWTPAMPLSPPGCRAQRARA